MQVTVSGGTLRQSEIDAYCARARKKYPAQLLKGIDIRVDGEFVELTYRAKPCRFSRIRRITGYLVGDMGRWNNAKRSEEGDRVKHA